MLAFFKKNQKNHPPHTFSLPRFFYLSKKAFAITNLFDRKPSLPLSLSPGKPNYPAGFLFPSLYPFLFSFPYNLILPSDTSG